MLELLSTLTLIWGLLCLLYWWAARLYHRAAAARRQDGGQPPHVASGLIGLIDLDARRRDRDQDRRAW